MEVGPPRKEEPPLAPLKLLNAAGGEDFGCDITVV